jgi:hypothetical protein
MARRFKHNSTHNEHKLVLDQDSNNYSKLCDLDEDE